jgi:hypothetical protein
LGNNSTMITFAQFWHQQAPHILDEVTVHFSPAHVDQQLEEAAEEWDGYADLPRNNRALDQVLRALEQGFGNARRVAVRGGTYPDGPWLAAMRDPQIFNTQNLPNPEVPTAVIIAFLKFLYLTAMNIEVDPTVRKIPAAKGTNYYQNLALTPGAAVTPASATARNTRDAGRSGAASARAAVELHQQFLSPRRQNTEEAGIMQTLQQSMINRNASMAAATAQRELTYTPVNRADTTFAGRVGGGRTPFLDRSKQPVMQRDENTVSDGGAATFPHTQIINSAEYGQIYDTFIHEVGFTIVAADPGVTHSFWTTVQSFGRPIENCAAATCYLIMALMYDSFRFFGGDGEWMDAPIQQVTITGLRAFLAALQPSLPHVEKLSLKNIRFCDEITQHSPILSDRNLQEVAAAYAGAIFNPTATTEELLDAWMYARTKHAREEFTTLDVFRTVFSAGSAHHQRHHLRNTPSADSQPGATAVPFVMDVDPVSARRVTFANNAAADKANNTARRTNDAIAAGVTPVSALKVRTVHHHSKDGTTTDRKEIQLRKKAEVKTAEKEVAAATKDPASHPIQGPPLSKAAQQALTGHATFTDRGAAQQQGAIATEFVSPAGPSAPGASVPSTATDSVRRNLLAELGAVGDAEALDKAASANAPTAIPSAPTSTPAASATDALTLPDVPEAAEQTLRNLHHNTLRSECTKLGIPYAGVKATAEQKKTMLQQLYANEAVRKKYIPSTPAVAAAATAAPTPPPVAAAAAAEPTPPVAASTPAAAATAGATDQEKSILLEEMNGRNKLVGATNLILQRRLRMLYSIKDGLAPSFKYQSSRTIATMNKAQVTAEILSVFGSLDSTQRDAALNALEDPESPSSSPARGRVTRSNAAAALKRA